MVTLSPALLSFLDRAGARVAGGGPASAADAEVTVEYENAVWCVVVQTDGFVLNQVYLGNRLRDLWASDLEVVEKTLVMHLGPAIRRARGGGELGYLPDIFALAPGFSHPGDHVHELAWTTDRPHRVVVLREELTESLPTYRSQYLTHPLAALIETMEGDGPGIFTNPAPQAGRPFRLPQRTHDWISASLDRVQHDRHSVLYTAYASQAIRISVFDTGFRVDGRGERETFFTRFDLWTPSLEVLQIHLTWQYAHTHTPGWPHTIVFVPHQNVLAPGFTVESIGDGTVRLCRDGALQAILREGRPGWDRVTELSRLLTIGLGALEASILGGGPPTLITDRDEAIRVDSDGERSVTNVALD
jgi:hypothetical protein